MPLRDGKHGQKNEWGHRLTRSLSWRRRRAPSYLVERAAIATPWAAAGRRWSDPSWNSKTRTHSPPWPSGCSARRVGSPILGNGPAAENLRPEIAEEVTPRDEHDGPPRVAESPVHVEDAHVEVQDGHFIPEQAGQVPGARGHKDPLLVPLPHPLRHVPRVQPHPVPRRYAYQRPVGDAERQRQQRRVVVPSPVRAVDAPAGVEPEGHEDGR